MTIYNIDLFNLLSLSKLPTTQNIIKICLHISECILKSLSDSLKTKNLREHWIIFKHIISLNDCLSTLSTAAPGKIDCAAVNNILFNIKKCKIGGTELNQIFTMTTLDGVNRITLIEILSILLENSMTCITTYLHSLPEMLVNVCMVKLRNIINDLFRIFPKMATFNQFKLTSIKLKVEFDDQNYEVKDLV